MSEEVEKEEILGGEGGGLGGEGLGDDCEERGDCEDWENCERGDWEE